MFKNIYIVSVILLIVLSACQKQNSYPPPSTELDKRYITLPADNLYTGSSYLSVYSEIYSMTEKTTHDLTATISMRNTSSNSLVYITKCDYYNTAGDLIRTYLDKPIRLKPLETVEIVIGQEDSDGGSGANFIFDWAVEDKTNEPLFEAVMISTYGQQGISFTTRGVRK